MHYGLVLNTIKIALARSGMLNATLSMIGQGEVDPTVASVAGSPTPLRGLRFAQATGSIMVDGVVAGDIVSADVAYSNQLDKVEVIRADGRIAGVDPGKAMSNGSIVVRGPRGTLFNKSRGKISAALSFGWALGDGTSLTFALPRVWLPKPKRPISGPKGVTSTFNYQASGAAAAQMTVTLVTDVASYA